MSKNLFNSIQLIRPKSNVFDLSHDVKLTGNMGNLIPTLALPCVPGDKFKISCQSLLRFAPLVSPVMHRMDVYMHYFFVPNRILWDNWENFITNTKVGGVIPAAPYMGLSGGGNGALADYLGIPSDLGGVNQNINMLPFAAYQKIYDEYYRDQNLIPLQFQGLADGDNSATWGVLNKLRKRAWEHDYFTASLPFAQKGDPVELPIASKDVSVYARPESAHPTSVSLHNDTGSVVFVPSHDTPDVSDSQLYANTSDLLVSPTTINDLRRAFRLQEWLEKAARGGSRYTENILSFFGVKSPDKRLQRPEYITGAKSPVVISEVLQTSAAAAQPTPQGNMAGHGISVTSGKLGSYYCEEHGYIIGIMSVMPKTAYQQGLNRDFVKFNNMDYFWPQFANIGEQEVLQKEIYAATTTPNATFGYVPRYAEYKFMSNRVAGQFRSTLDYWTLARIFATDPALNQQFVECTPDTRIFAVTDTAVDHLYCQILHNIKAIRPMPVFGTPSF